MNSWASLREAQVLIEAWRRYCNTERPHASLGWKTPAEYASALGGAAAPPRAGQPTPCTNPRSSDTLIPQHTAL